MLFGAGIYALLALFIVFNSLNVEYFFTLSLLGLLVLVHLMAPQTTNPKWKSRVNLFIGIGVLVFILIIVRKALGIVGLPLF